MSCPTRTRAMPDFPTARRRPISIARRRRNGSCSSAYARISVVRLRYSRATLAAGSAIATVRNTIRQDASVKVRRRRTSPCRLTHFYRPPRSKSADGETHGGQIHLRSEDGLHPLARYSSANSPSRQRHGDDVSDAAESEHLVHL